MSEYYFVDPPKEIGEVIERGSNLKTYGKYKIVPTAQVWRRRVMHIALTVILTFLGGMLLWDNGEVNIHTFVLLGMIALVSYVALYFVIYKDMQNVLEGVNYFLGTKGAYYATVKYNYSHRDEGLYFYDEIKDIKKRFVFKNVRKGYETSYTPRKLNAKVTIKTAKKGSKTYRFEFNLDERLGGGYEIADKSDPSYYFYRFLERLEDEWAKRKTGALQKQRAHIDELAYHAPAVTDPTLMLSMDDQDLMQAIPLVLLTVVAVYIVVGGDLGVMSMLLMMGGGTGWYVSSFFAEFKAMRVVMAAFFWCLILGLVGVLGVVAYNLIVATCPCDLELPYQRT